MNIQKLILPLLLLLTISGCSSVQVSQDYDTEMDFPEVHSFSWRATSEKKSDDVRVSNPLLHKRIHQAIDRVMAAKGFSREDNPDVRIDYDYSIKSELDSETLATGFGFGVGNYGRYGGFGFSARPDIRQNDIASLVIDFYDAQSGVLLWRGRGSDLLESHPTPQQTTTMVNRMVESILAQYPPR